MERKPVISRFVIVKRPYDVLGSNDVGFDERDIFFLQGVLEKPVDRRVGSGRLAGNNQRPHEYRTMKIFICST